MTDDTELLRRFVEDGSQESLGELIRNRVNFVYTAALRQVGGDSHMAEDVTQGVFLELVRKAPRLVRRPVLAGWLYTATRMLARNAVRSHRRWRRREQEANTMTTLLPDSTSDADWAQLRPVLDEAMHELDETDREAILLRYFDNRPYAEIGARIGLKENTVRMRADRALDKLRGRLTKRGIVSTAAALGTTLAAQTEMSAPTGLAAAVTAASLAGVSAGGIGATSAVATLGFMSTSKFILSLAGMAALLGLGIYVGAVQFAPAPAPAPSDGPLLRQISELRVENRRLGAEMERLAAERAALPPPAPVAVPPVPAVPTQVNPLLTQDQISRGVMNNLRQLGAALAQFRLENGRSPASLNELVGEHAYVRTLIAADGESYEGIDLSTPGAVMTVTTAGGLTLTYNPNPTPAAASAAPVPTLFSTAQAQAIEAFRAANPGRSPAPQELTPYFEQPAFRAEYVDRLKLMALQQQLGGMMQEVTKAATAYKTATGSSVSNNFAGGMQLAPYIENAADRAQFIAAWNKINNETAP